MARSILLQAGLTGYRMRSLEGRALARFQPHLAPSTGQSCDPQCPPPLPLPETPLTRARAQPLGLAPCRQSLCPSLPFSPGEIFRSSCGHVKPSSGALDAAPAPGQVPAPGLPRHWDCAPLLPPATPPPRACPHLPPGSGAHSICDKSLSPGPIQVQHRRGWVSWNSSGFCLLAPESREHTCRDVGRWSVGTRPEQDTWSV